MNAAPNSGPTQDEERRKAPNSQYSVEFVPTDSVTPSPENDEIYGAIEHDHAMDDLIASIERIGLAEPIIISADNFILSGHRRYFACRHLRMETIPVRRQTIRRADDADFHRRLTEYNPQRIKNTSVLLREALLRYQDDDASVLLYDHRRASTAVDVKFMPVVGSKCIRPVSEKKRTFLRAAQAVIQRLRPYWPLSIRQIHYQLLNAPPLISEPKQSRFDPEHYRYANNNRSYDALVDLLTNARYTGEVDMTCIDDATRPREVPRGYNDVAHFLRTEFANFLSGYHRSPQLDQPRHIEVLGEKNTLMQIFLPVCRDYYVPMTLGRGYGSIPIWRDIAERFLASGKDAMTLIVASDFDPEGFDLADDAVRSLRKLGVAPDYHRIAVKEEQIRDLDLRNDFNPAKETSSRLTSFVERTGGMQTWELEALPPDYLQDQLRAAIESNMDMDIYNESIRQTERDAEYLASVRKQIAADLKF